MLQPPAQQRSPESSTIVLTPILGNPELRERFQKPGPWLLLRPKVALSGN